MSFSEHDKDYSLSGLQEYAEILIGNNQGEIDEHFKTSVCLAVAGGGGHAISTLSATPGASSLFLEGTVAYDRKSFQSYVGLPSSPAPMASTPSGNNNGNKKFKYNSLEAAKMASETALQRAMGFRALHLKQMNGCVGVGSSSALVSSSSPEDFQGKGFVVATRADGLQVSINVTLAPKREGRSRLDEDVFLSHLVLRSIELIQTADKNDVLRMGSSETRTNKGDLITESWESLVPQDNGEEEDAAYTAARRLLNGDEQALVLLPIYQDNRPVAFRALKYPGIANGSLVMPGSFNPPHKGHISLAQAAVRAAHRMGLSRRHDEKPVFMELSLTNVDKPPIDPATVSDRVHKFLQLENLPEQWGIILTRAPLFSQKVDCLQDCVVDSRDSPLKKLSFVIGADTMVRILSPKYYNDDKLQMIDTLLSMKGAHFFAGGRVEQKKESPEPVRFITGREELRGLPQELKDKFTIIEEQEFRVDISSTELRKQLEEERLAAPSTKEGR